jgi:hypothetical protein
MTTTLQNDIYSYMNLQLDSLTPSWAVGFTEVLDELKTGLQLEGAFYCLHTYTAVAKSVETKESRVINLINFVSMWRKCHNLLTEQQGRVLLALPLEVRASLADVPNDFIVDLTDDLVDGAYGADDVPAAINDYKLTQLNKGHFDNQIDTLSNTLKTLGEQIMYNKTNSELGDRYLVVRTKLQLLRTERERLVEYQEACMA